MGGDRWALEMILRALGTGAASQLIYTQGLLAKEAHDVG